MRRILWWTGKELREHRVVLALLLVGLVVGSWFWAWEGRGRPEDAGPMAAPYAPDAAIPHRYSRVEGWESPLVVSLGVVLVVLAGGLFASDLRRGCGVLTARTPGGWGAAFAGKLLFLLLALIGTLALHGLLLGRLAALYDLRCPDIRGGMHAVDELWLGPVSETYVTAVCAMFAAAPLLLLASLALPYIGVPQVAGAAAALGLALPFAVMRSGDRYLFDWWLGSMRPLLALGAVIALAVMVWVWWRHIRAGHSRRRVVLTSAGVLLVAGGATCAAALAARAVYIDYSLDEPDVQISRIFVGSDGRYAFVMAGRGDPSPTPGVSPWRGGVERCFRIDLATGASVRLRGGVVVGRHPPHALGTRIDVPLAEVVAPLPPSGQESESTWLDARTGAEVARGVMRLGELPPAAQAALEAGIERRWALDDGAGRRIWLDEAGLRTRLGDAAPSTTVLDLPRALRLATAVLSIHGGWALQWGAGPQGRLGGSMQWGAVASVDATDGKVRHLTIDRIQPRGMQPLAWLSPREVLLLPDNGTERATDPHAWRILDLDLGTSRAALPEGVGSTSRLEALGVLGATSVLVHEGGDAGSLQILDLKDGRVRPVAWDRDPPARVRRSFCWRPQRLDTLGGGSLVVDLIVDEDSVGPRPDERPPILINDGYVGGGTTLDGRLPLRHLVAVVGADGSAWRLEPRARFYAADLLGVDVQGRVMMLEDARQIVRYGPGTGVREVLFPRAP